MRIYALQHTHIYASACVLMCISLCVWGKDASIISKHLRIHFPTSHPKVKPRLHVTPCFYFKEVVTQIKYQLNRFADFYSASPVSYRVTFSSRMRPGMMLPVSVHLLRHGDSAEVFVTLRNNESLAVVASASSKRVYGGRAIRVLAVFSYTRACTHMRTRTHTRYIYISSVTFALQ